MARRQSNSKRCARATRPSAASFGAAIRAAAEVLEFVPCSSIPATDKTGQCSYSSEMSQASLEGRSTHDSKTLRSKCSRRRSCPQWHTGCDVWEAMIATFFGTKGGTGTTTLAVNCAADIQHLSGRSTLIVDAKQ